MSRSNRPIAMSIPRFRIRHRRPAALGDRNRVRADDGIDLPSDEQSVDSSDRLAGPDLMGVGADDCSHDRVVWKRALQDLDGGLDGELRPWGHECPDWFGAYRYEITECLPLIDVLLGGVNDHGPPARGGSPWRSDTSAIFTPKSSQRPPGNAGTERHSEYGRRGWAKRSARRAASSAGGEAGEKRR